MPCFHPIKGYRAHARNPSGKRSIVIVRRDAHVDQPVTLPCGQCIHCRLERSRQWAIRCVHEKQLHEESCFITLTYSDKELPKYGTLVVEDYQKFMKRLRFKYSEKKIRFFHCGEYGEKTFRPHYHAILFGHDFVDKYHWETNPNTNEKYYRSETLEELWPQGNSIIGEATFESAAYVARYITKKITGPRAENHYSVVDKDTGEILQLKPEYVTMSRRPGIGKNWLEKYKNDVLSNDSVVIRGKEMKPPKSYDVYLEQICKEDFDKIKAHRQNNAKNFEQDSTWERLRVLEEVQEARLTQLKRKLESDY